MRTRVRCDCGWQRELSEFYAGKRIRCPECMAVVEVPGRDPRGAYLYPPMSDWPSGGCVKPKGRWVTIGNGRECGTLPPNGLLNQARKQQCCRGRSRGLVFLPLIVVFMIVLFGHHNHRPQHTHRHHYTTFQVPAVTQPAAPHAAPAPKREPQAEPQQAQPRKQSTPEPDDPQGEREDEF